MLLYLLFKGEAPTPQQGALLENLALALANPGPRDASVHAAMCGGVGGSTAASCLMAALAVGAGGLGGGREVWRAMQRWQSCGTDLALWLQHLREQHDEPGSAWPACEHPAGFDPHGLSTPTIVLQTLQSLARLSPGPALAWLDTHRNQLEQIAGLPLAMPAIAATALYDLDYSAEQGEMLYLLLRLPGAAVHALEQRSYGHKKFPFYCIELNDDPKKQEPSHAS